LGQIYISFGSIGDQSFWHGWIFEINLDSWTQSPQAAISAVFTTTAGADCAEPCGGGLWARAGPQIHRSPDGFEILVQSGNGRLNIDRRMYANSLLRLKPGLKFTPACDPQRCANFNEVDPSPLCLMSCENLFVPRLLPGENPLRPADGSCDDKSYLQCLNANDWDFGGNAPVRIELPTGGAAYVAAGKAGDVFLLDADFLGIMYDRKQAGTPCGTAEVPCPDPSDGLIMTQPKVAWIDGAPVVVIPTYNQDHTKAAGIVAYKVTTATGQPRLEELWRVPNAFTVEAKQWFRTPPTRLVLQNYDGEPIAWIGDSSTQGRLLGISVRNGGVLTNVRTAGVPVSSVEPVVFRNMLYVPTLIPGPSGRSWIEAYRIGGPIR
jgi:hypothetical protein